MIYPPFLKKGDKIGIVAPARKITKDELMESFEIITNNGFEVVYTDSVFAEDNQFAGNDNHRAVDLQNMLNNRSIKAIMFARGGYGSVRIIDKLDFSKFILNPKWLVGYSDVTVFHNHIQQNYGIATLHATMPINFPNNTTESLQSMFGVLKGNSFEIKFGSSGINRIGNVNGIIVGGNLSVLYSLIGSSSFPETKGKILFLEDLDEYLYHIDRMMMGLKRAGKLNNIAGLLVGGMTKMNDNIIAFGKTAEEIIIDVVDEYDYPVYFGFPSGHMDNNMPIVIGSWASIKCDGIYSTYKFSYH